MTTPISNGCPYCGTPIHLYSPPCCAALNAHYRLVGAAARADVREEDEDETRRLYTQSREAVIDLYQATKERDGTP